MRVLIIDDHAVVRRGLMGILDEAFRNVEFGEAREAGEALRFARDESWDIVVLDLTLPGQSGIEVLSELKRTCPDLPVLVLSMHPEDQFATRVLRTGGEGYLTKDRAPEELVRAVKKVIAGGKYVSPELAEKLAVDVSRGSDKPLHERLSNREFQILRRIGAGRTVTQIADELVLSVKTVSTYRSRILEKMNMKTSAELTRYAIEQKLVE